MKQLSQDEGSEASARIADEHGFTLIELLVAMVVSIIVIGGGVYGIADAFKQSTQVTDRLITNDSAEVGIQRFTLDLRYALNGTCTNGIGTVTGVQVGMPATGIYTVSMCGQAGTLASTTTTTAATTSTYPTFTSAPQPVIWACNTTASTAAISTPITVSIPAETCDRMVLVTSPKPAALGSVSFHGITALTLSGQVNGATTSLISTTATYCTQTGGTICSYSLSSGLSNSLASVGIAAKLADLQNPLNQADTSIVQSTKPIPVQTAVELRNFGT